MGKRESAPQVNAGSMADIAFLLLIFFLVTTTIETDVGLNRMLPPEDGDFVDYKQRNILSVLIDGDGNLLVNEKAIDFQSLREKAMDFIDNGGAVEGVAFCDYCRGKRNANSSVNPLKAVIVLNTQRETNYGAYVAIQNELMAAYSQLRNKESIRLYGSEYGMLDSLYHHAKTSGAEKEQLRVKIKTIQKKYPINISEAELKYE